MELFIFFVFLGKQKIEFSWRDVVRQVWYCTRVTAEIEKCEIHSFHATGPIYSLNEVSYTSSEAANYDRAKFFMFL